MRPWAAIAALACACTVGPKYERPQLDIPKDWRTGPGEQQSLANVKWWELFHDGALQALVRDGLVRNTDLRIAAARVEEFRGLLAVARSGQIPQVTLAGSVARQKVSALSSPSGTSVVGNAFDVSGQISYQADFWGQYRLAAEEARANLLATEEARRNVVVSVVSGVAQGYFQLRELDLELDITRRTVASFQDSLRLTRIRYEGNVASELDVRQAETALYTATAQVPQLELQIAQQEDALSVLAGRNPGPIERGLPLTEQKPPPQVPAGLPSQLLERRPDVRQAEQQLASAYAAVGVATAQFFPQFTLTGSGGFASAAASTLLTGPALAWQALASLAQPLFTGGRLRGNLHAAEARRLEAEIAFGAALQRALADVNDSLVAYRKASEELVAESSLVQSSAAAVKLANARYTAGVSTYLEVLDAERQLFSAQLSQARTQGLVLTSLVRLYAALGGGWDPGPVASGGS
jgi:multidrug efflux system outer membrane protein